eukprot:5404170-Prymnesium_polylepis.1
MLGPPLLAAAAIFCLNFECAADLKDWIEVAKVATTITTNPLPEPGSIGGGGNGGDNGRGGGDGSGGRGSSEEGGGER